MKQMKNNFYKLIMIALCAICLFLFTGLGLKTITANADDDTTYFTGFSRWLSEFDLYDETNTYNYDRYYYNERETHDYYLTNGERNSETVEEGVPQITVITHGLGGNAEHWSNEAGDFMQTDGSIIERLQEESLKNNGTGAYIYWAKMEKESDESRLKKFTLYDLNSLTEKGKKWGYRVYDKDIQNSVLQASNELTKVEKLIGIGKHIIVIFDSRNSNQSNYKEYEDFNYVVSKIVYDVKYHNGGVLPKINLIGHSRGGLTNLQYALDHPDMVDSLFSLATPYFGSNTAATSIGRTIANDSDGLNDIINEEIYIHYYNRWKSRDYSKIKAYALGSYETVDYLCDMLSDNVAFLGANGITITEKQVNWLRFAVKHLPHWIIRNYVKNHIPDASELVDVLLEDIEVVNHGCAGTRYYYKNDVLVNLSSQLGKSAIGDYGFITYEKCYESSTGKLAVPNSLPVGHNMEPRDDDFINYIITKINLGNKGRYIYRKISETTATFVGFSDLNNEDGDVVIPSSINGLTIDTIASDVFKGEGESVISLYIPSTISAISERSFKNLPNLKAVIFENASTISEIGYQAFSECPQLSNFNSTTEGKLVVPENIIRLKGYVFEGSAFTDIDFGIKITKIGNNAFAYCRKLQALNIPNNVEEVGFEAFENCTGLKSVNLAESLEILKFNTFRDCTNLESIVLPKLLKEIGSGVFQNCTNLKSIALPESIELIEKMAFQGCTGFAEVCIPRQLDFVNMDVFRGCTGLKKLVFENRGGQSDKKNLKIETGAFADCTGLENLVIPEFVTSLGNGAFENVNLNKVYYDGSRAAYAKLKANSSANDNFFNADTYFYSANKPFSGTNYWRYDSDGTPEIWPSKQLQGITANGESRAVTTDAIVITFDSDPGENFGVNNVYTNGANVDAVSGSGTTRVITVSEVTVKDGEKLKFTLKPAGDYYFVNREIEVAVCAKVCKIFYYEAGKNFFSGDISDCPTEYMEGQTTKLVTPMKFGFEFDGWHLNEDGSGERIYNITPDYRGNITLYAKWERNDALSWGDENFKIMYYTEKSRTDNLDILFKSEDGFGDLSYYVREALFPALAQLRVDGYGYELNSTLISAYYPDDDKMSATIVLNDGLKFSSDNNLTANDFKAYYDFVVNAYEDLPKPLKHILGVDANDSRTLEIFLTRPYDIMYVLSELRAVDSELLGEISGMTIEEANACVHAKADVVTYGRYKIGEISEAGGILLMPNEKYTFYNENSAYDITLYICGDFQEAGEKYFNGETDACYNFNAEDASDIWAGEETHAYDDRVRMYLALNSTAFSRYSESDKQTIIYALGLLIDYDLIKMVFSEAEHENNNWFPDGYPFDGLPDYGDPSIDIMPNINYRSDIADRQAKARMIFNDELKINPRELVLTINVKNEERYIILADILKNSFDAVDIRLEVNYVETEEEANSGDLFFVFYDFTGKVLTVADFLENEDLNIIFTLYGDAEENFLRELTEEYEEAATESKKLEILGEIQRIMACFVVKINCIGKYYLASPEYFEFTNGHPANLVY